MVFISMQNYDLRFIEFYIKQHARWSYLYNISWGVPHCSRTVHDGQLNNGVNFTTPETIRHVIFQYRNNTGSVYCFPGPRWYRVPRVHDPTGNERWEILIVMSYAINCQQRRRHVNTMKYISIVWGYHIICKKK